MPNDETAIVRFHGQGEIPLAHVSGFLSALEEAYSGVSLFFTAMEAIDKWGPHPYLELASYRRRPAFGPFRTISNSRFEPRELRLSRQTSARSRLTLRAVRLESPGWWDVLGKLNPLEVIRQGLNDRHERKKDNDYRNSAEREKGVLENELLRNTVIAGRIAIARDVGFSDEDLAPIVNNLLLEPFNSLGQYQDRGVVSTVEAPKPMRNDDGAAV